MKYSLQGVVVVSVVLFVVGCDSLPSQRGTWKGTGGAIELFDTEEGPCSCATLTIKEGTALKEFIPQRVVLVNSKLKTFEPKPYEGKKIRVHGLIYSCHPTCGQTGKTLLGYVPYPVGQLGGIYVIKVRKIEVY